MDISSMKGKNTKGNSRSTKPASARKKQSPTSQQRNIGDSTQSQAAHAETTTLPPQISYSETLKITPEMLEEAIRKRRETQNNFIDAKDKELSPQEETIKQIADKMERIDILKENSPKLTKNWDANENILFRKIGEMVISLSGKAKDGQLSNEEENTLKDVDNLLKMWIEAKTEEGDTSAKGIKSFRDSVKEMVNNKTFQSYHISATASYFGESFRFVNEYRRQQFMMIKKGGVDYTEPEFWTDKTWNNLIQKVPRDENGQIKLLEALEALIEKIEIEKERKNTSETSPTENSVLEKLNGIYKEILEKK